MASLNLLKKFKYYNSFIELEFYYFLFHSKPTIIIIAAFSIIYVYTAPGPGMLRPRIKVTFSGISVGRWCTAHISFEMKENAFFLRIIIIITLSITNLLNSFTRCPLFSPSSSFGSRFFACSFYLNPHTKKKQ